PLPPLLDERGRRAASLLLDEMSGSARPRAAHRVPVALIRRRSCGCDVADDLAQPPGAEALAACDNAALAAHLVRMALLPVPSDPAQGPRDIWPGVETLI